MLQCYVASKLQSARYFAPEGMWHRVYDEYVCGSVPETTLPKTNVTIFVHVAQLMLLPLTVSCSSKSSLVLPFWYRLTRIVLDKGPFNGCCFCFCCFVHVACGLMWYDRYFRGFFWMTSCFQFHIMDPLARRVFAYNSITLPSRPKVTMEHK